MKKLTILLICCATLCSSTAFARKKKQAVKPTTEQKKPETEKPSIVRPGMIDVSKVKNDWYWEIPKSMLGRDMLVTTRFISTPADSKKFGGEQVNEQTVYLELNADSTLLIRSHGFYNVSDSSNIISKAVTISNENAIIGHLALEKSSKKDTLKVKVTQFFNEDNAAIGIPTSGKTSFKLGGQSFSFINDMKSFPTNTEVRVTKTYSGNSESPLVSVRETGKATVQLNISFVLLPEHPMMPRFYDPRVGYFTINQTEYTDEQQRVEGKRLITRWRLEPRPEDIEKMKRGELVEPIKPIVYYIDPATPKQWRKYLIQGVNDWQVAFEKAGFKNAIMAKEWPEDADSTMSMEDARCSMIRYLASPIENAYGPHVSDPRTGEILESHICWYHNVMSLVHDWYMIQAGSIDEAARKMNFDEELMGQLIRFVSSHEVGHTLGLRHNFGSSSTVPVDSLRDKAWVEAHGHTPSIMDYARFNYVAQPEDGIQRTGIFPRINDYDLWAIEWGYRPMLDAKDEYEDHAMLEPMTAKAQKQKRLWWGDGETSNDDPRRQTEDLGDDAVKASTYGLKNLKREIKQLPTWTADERDLYGNNLGNMHTQIRSQYMRYMNHVARNIGGMLQTYRTAPQGGTIYEPTPKARQKAALDFLDREMLNEPTWIREVSYAKTLGADPQNLTLSIASSVAVMLLNRASSCNDLYPIDSYMTDITRLIMKEADSRQAVTKYRARLQSSYVDALITMYQKGSAGSQTRVFALRTLQQLKSKTQTAAASGADSATRAHFAELNDRIQRALVIK